VGDDLSRFEPRDLIGAVDRAVRAPELAVDADEADRAKVHKATLG
jgi:hypothetical protein